MSPWGQQRPFGDVGITSADYPRAALKRAFEHFAFVPKGDIAAIMANIEFEGCRGRHIDGLFTHSVSDQQRRQRARRRSIHRNPRTCRAVQQPFQVKAGQLIIRVLANMGRKRRQRTRIICFELGKGVEIAGGRRGVVLCARERFEGA